MIGSSSPLTLREAAKVAALLLLLPPPPLLPPPTPLPSPSRDVGITKDPELRHPRLQLRRELVVSFSAAGSPVRPGPELPGSAGRGILQSRGLHYRGELPSTAQSTA